jgi:hypothetical protein
MLRVLYREQIMINEKDVFLRQKIGDIQLQYWSVTMWLGFLAF